MNVYVYHWNLRPRPDIRVEVHIEAASAIAARREIVAFLREHEAQRWEIETVSRSDRSTLAEWVQSSSPGHRDH
jgi:hypothetical protein